MEQLIDQLTQSSNHWAYWILFISAFVENIFPPIPGDTVTLIGAYFVGTGRLNFWGVYVTTTLGSVLGFSTLFLLAYWLQRDLIERFQPRWVQTVHLDRVEGWFRKYGYWIIVGNRFLSGARSVISIVAGLSRLKIPLVIMLATVSCLLWNGMLLYLGAFLGKNWEEVVAFIKLYNKIVLVGLLLIIGGYLIYYFLKKRKN